MITYDGASRYCANLSFDSNMFLCIVQIEWQFLRIGNKRHQNFCYRKLSLWRFSFAESFIACVHWKKWTKPKHKLLSAINAVSNVRDMVTLKISKKKIWKSLKLQSKIQLERENIFDKKRITRRVLGIKIFEQCSSFLSFNEFNLTFILKYLFSATMNTNN